MWGGFLLGNNLWVLARAIDGLWQFADGEVGMDGTITIVEDFSKFQAFKSLASLGFYIKIGETYP